MDAERGICRPGSVHVPREVGRATRPRSRVDSGVRGFGPFRSCHPGGMGLLTPLAVKIGSWSVTPRFLPQITATDKFIQKVSRGRVTILDIAGLPNLMLTVIGRK